MISKKAKLQAVKDFLEPIIAVHLPDFEYRLFTPYDTYNISTIIGARKLLGDPIRYCEIVAESIVDPEFPDIEIQQGRPRDLSHVVTVSVWLEFGPSSQEVWEKLWDSTVTATIGIVPALTRLGGLSYSDGCFSHLSGPSEVSDIIVQPVSGSPKYLAHFGQVVLTVT